MRIFQSRRQWPTVNLTFVFLATILLALPSQIHSFGTVDIQNTLHQRNEHEHITRAALACHPNVKPSGDCFEALSMDQLAGTNGRFGAVGEPDKPLAEGHLAHCDDADYFNSDAYPRSREAATGVLLGCVQHLQDRLNEGISAAEAMLDKQNRISALEVSMALDCHFGADIVGRAKCNALQGFGRAIHGAQDFYSHSNWADIAEPPYTLQNPPGLGLFGPSKVIDLRRDFDCSIPHIPVDLTTGCYNGDIPLVSDKFDGVGECTRRITHKALNKDHGVIDPVTGFVSFTDPDTPRGVDHDNFARAVRAAIDETVRQWSDFRAELRARYGQRRANLMICALTRDNPTKSCHGRKIAIVIDSSGSNTATDPSDLRIVAAKAFNSQLVTRANVNSSDEQPDRVTVIDFDDSARVVYPLGDPSQATFDGIDSSGGTSIASGVKLAIDELTKDKQDPTTDRTGVMVLTDGQDYNIFALIAQLVRAKALGIRVDFGFLSPPANKIRRRKRSHHLFRRDPSIDLITAILDTGGFFSTIDSADAQKSFVDLVIAYGPTNLDDAYGANGGGSLLPGLTVTGLSSASLGRDVFSYHAKVGQQLEFKVLSLSNQLLNLTLHDVRSVEDINSTVTDSLGQGVITFVVIRETDLELIIQTDDQNVGVYSVALNVTNDPSVTTSSDSSQSASSTGFSTVATSVLDVTSQVLANDGGATSNVVLNPTATNAPEPAADSGEVTPNGNPNLSATNTPELPTTKDGATPGGEHGPITATTPGQPFAAGTPNGNHQPGSTNESLMCTSSKITVSTRTEMLTGTCHTNLATAGIANRLADSNDNNVTVNNALASAKNNSIFDRSSRSFQIFVALICVIIAQTLVIFGAIAWWCRSRGKGEKSSSTISDNKSTDLLSPSTPGAASAVNLLGPGSQ